MSEELQTPWDRAAKTKSVLQEERLAKSQGGSRQINSGRSTWTSKRDNVLGRIFKFLIEARTTEKNSYSIKRDEFLSLRKEAFQTPPGLLPGMQIDIQDLSLIVVELKDWEDMQNRMFDLEERENARVIEDD